MPILSAKPQSVQVANGLSPQDIIIAVMGPTGSGKSSFINTATGRSNAAGAGRNFQSYTTQISAVRMELSNGAVVFVEIPGFDDTYRANIEVLEMISDWMTKTYKRGILLNGILHLQCITDSRVAGTPLRNLRMLENLCGEEALQNTVLVTTRWNKINPEAGKQRQIYHEQYHWKSMMERGSKSARYLNTRESAWEVIQPFLEAGNNKCALLLQKELVDLKMQLRQTSAGKILYPNIEELVEKQQETLQKFRAEIKKPHNEEISNALKESLALERLALESQLDKTFAEMKSLKSTKGDRFVRMVTRLKYSWSVFQDEKRQAMLQRQLVDLEMQLSQTTAGQERYAIMEELVNKRGETLQKLRDELKKTNNEETLNALSAGLTDLGTRFDKMVADAEMERTKESSDPKDLKESDIVFVVMGPTGSGKSNLIDNLAGQPSLRASHRLECSTSDVEVVRMHGHSEKGDRIVLVDTPGFDDANKSDLEILGTIADWLSSTYRNKIKLSGILYLHRITDNRMAGSPCRSLRLFGKLCGDRAAHRVSIVTTMWDTLQKESSHAVAVEREDELKKNYWKGLLDKGSTTFRFLNTQDSAWDILKPFLAQEEKVTLLLQEELVDLKKRLNETKATKTLCNELRISLADQKESIRLLATLVAEKDCPQSASERLLVQHKETELELQTTLEYLQSLKIPLSRQILLLLPHMRTHARPVKLIEGP